MNIKKSSLAVLACATACASVSAFAVSAATPGISDGSESTKTVVVDPAVPTDVAVEIGGGEAINVTIPAGTLGEGEVTVHVAETEEFALDEIKTDKNLKSAKVLNLYFTDAEGKAIAADGEVELSVDGSYNAVYVLNEDGSVTEIPAEVVDGKLVFKAPVLAEGQKVVLGVKEEVSQESSDVSQTSEVSQTSQTSQTSQVSNGGTGTNNGTGSNNGGTTTNNGSTNNNGGTGTTNTSNNSGTATQTGDAGFETTVAVFGVMAVVALGTAVVASKSKKASK